MTRMDAIAWVLSVCTDLRLSQAKTLADLVASAMSVPRISLAAIGRSLVGPVAQASYQTHLALRGQCAGAG
jgi:hypothetical protein